jgi:hypothetical protein
MATLLLCFNRPTLANDESLSVRNPGSQESGSFNLNIDRFDQE